MKKINKVKVLGIVFLIIGIVTCLCVLIIHQNDKQNIVITSKIKNYQNKHWLILKMLFLKIGKLI